MSKILVIVESPGKIVKIGQYLGPDYIVKASFGHVQDLDKKTLSIDVENNFKPLYITTPDKVKVVKELKSLTKECSDVILASDEDREGEAIAYSLANVLNLKNPKRIVFHEITKKALLDAVSKPRLINDDMVNSQQTRRLLDRLVGYKISPVLWANLGIEAKSAGRVQSIIVKIIVDKEKEIDKSISEPYFKTVGLFNFKESNINSVLYLDNKMYIQDTKQYITKINKNNIFKVNTVDNKKSIRKPSAPFITSSLQQEASTKLHFPVKKTMEVAQKLYEGGHITYMRTDCPNMSEVAINEATKYIIDTWGKIYSDPKNYVSKNNAQEAHECIRPTHLDKPEIEKLEGDQMRLYSLIWKRTIASQMSNAKINIQTISISGFSDERKDLLFISNLENIEFDGYLIVYDNSDPDSEKEVGKIEIKVDDILKMKSIKLTEEYTKPPLRYNEALLVKYLEKNGIGRPSTYASIISKVIERNYVEIKNIDGVKKISKQLELDTKFKIKEIEKEVFIGKEQKKLVPTESGKNVNNFMELNFVPIMDIQFTANMETFLDKIAIGKANWITVLRNFYDMFNPIVEKLLIENKKEKSKDKDELLGDNIYKGVGKYGPYVKIEENGKYRYASIKELDINKITLQEAKDLLQYPKLLGKFKGGNVFLNKGPYGFYIKYLDKNYPALEDSNIDSIKDILESGDKYALKSFKVKDKIINIKNGEFGHYLQIVSGSKKQNISIPSKYDIENMNIDDVLKIIADKNGSKKNN